MQDFKKGRLYKLKSHQQDQKGNQQPCEIFDSSMAEGMLRIRLLPGHFKSDQCEQGGTGIGKVVEGIRGNGYGPADGPG